MTATPPTPPARPRGSRRAVAPVTDPTTSTTEESAGPLASAAPKQAVTEKRVPEKRAPEKTAPEKTAQSTSAPGPAPQTSPGRRIPALALVLALVGVLCLGGAAAFVWKAHAVRSTDAATNLALVDTPLTNEVVGQVSAGLNRIFSYDSTAPATTQQAADALLVGDASGQYKTLFEALQSKAAGQQLTLSTKTLLGGVSLLTPTSARLLVFLDQTATRSSDSSSSTAAAQLSVAAQKQGNVWKISEIRPL